MANSTAPFDLRTYSDTAQEASGTASERAGKTAGTTDRRDGTIAAVSVVAAVLSRRTLDAIDRDVPVEVVSLALEDDLVAWLRAVGIAEGERVIVLRRAAFGGPLHVRTSSGGEFALHRSLARSIFIRSVPEDAA